ncbi:hypothetical protein FSP39_009626 [Pinctada imbricata]|uniref:tRNA-queuosine alpha-mannosyltransferase n=1 Tax=Pinctada imbricata TaxID=66713 RepID=A0AA88XSD4_PINIB|nr:hypothetical protein FSP39_009626 [Pinctada imbricata]
MVDVGHKVFSKVLIVEPFYGGSHKQLVDLLKKYIPGCTLVTMTAKKWHWRARTAALSLADMIPCDENYRALFCSSVLNLAELVALRPDLAKLRKVVYFHENQLVYPVRKSQDRDFQYGYNQILTCLTADEVIFNSEFNKNSFLTSIKSFLKLMPDYRPKGLAEKIRKKSRVVYFPVDFESISEKLLNCEKCEKHRINVADRDCNTEYEKTDASQSKRRKEEINSSQEIDKLVKLGQTSTSANFKTSSEIHTSIQIGEKDLTYQRDITDNCGDDFYVNTGNKDSLIKLEQLGSEGEPSHRTKIDNKSENTGKIVNCVSKSNKTEAVFPKVQDSSVEDGSQSNLSKTDLTDSREVVRTDYIREKCEPIGQLQCGYGVEKSGPLHIVWAHRWEHDKDPETFLRVMMRLHKEGFNFRLSVLGEQYTDVPDIFTRAKEELTTKVAHWGYLDSKTEYYLVLRECDVAVSTALHEFFGVSMLEASYLGCYPLCPNRLVYPEIYPKCCLYNTETQLYKRLRNFCLHPVTARNQTIQVDLQRYHSSVILQQLTDILFNS